MYNKVTNIQTRGNKVLPHMNLHYGVQDSGIVEAFAEHDSCLKRLERSG